MQDRRVLPGVASLGGMVFPALGFLAFNLGNADTVRGWAIPAATDIAFALGVLSLLGSRVPMSLKVFLTALAIIDDLGAVAIIALFYTADLSFPALGLAALILACLVGLNRFGITWSFFLGELLGIVFIFAGFLVSIEVFSDIRLPFTRVVLVRRKQAEPPGAAPA